jgi:hypothetical protein
MATAATKATEATSASATVAAEETLSKIFIHLF